MQPLEHKVVTTTYTVKIITNNNYSYRYCSICELRDLNLGKYIIALLVILMIAIVIRNNC